MFIGLSSFYGTFTPILANATNATFANQIKTQTLSGVNLLDAGMGIFVAGLLLVSVVSAFLSRSYPFFAVFAILINGLFIIMAWALSSGFADFMNSSVVSAYKVNFPITIAIMANMPYITGIACIVIIAAIYIKPERGMVGAYEA